MNLILMLFLLFGYTSPTDSGVCGTDHTRSYSHFSYKGWEVKWLGWHTSLKYKKFFGVYLAKNPKYPEVILYASYPGKRGATTADKAIDSCPTLEKDQHTLPLDSTDKQLLRAQLICMHDLMKTIEEYKP